MSSRLSIVLGSLLAAMLAGCTGGAAGPEAEDTAALPVAASAADLAKLDANSSLETPTPWALGDWFGVHVFVGMDDQEGTHYNTMVVEDAGDSWVLATDDAAAAKEEAVFDFPIMGAFRKADLGTSGLGGRWDLLKFPLTDKAQWSSSVAMDPMDPSSTLKLEFEATFNPSIKTADGHQPGYDIVAVDDAARQVLAFDYVPSVKWFTRFLIYDTATEDPLDYFISARSMGTGEGWTGTYYRDTATSLVQSFDIVGVDPGNPSQPYTQAAPYSGFTVSEQATYLFGFVFSFSFGGAHEVVLVGPDSQPREFRSYNGAVAGEDADAFIDEPAIPGQGHLATGGAGVVAGGGAFLWEITETSGTL